MVGHDQLLSAAQVQSLYYFGTFSDFSLPKEKPQVLSLFSAADFPQISPVQQDVLAFSDQFKDIFAQGPNNYGLSKGVIHQINTGDTPSFCANPYFCSQVKGAQVSKELKQLLDSDLLDSS